MNEKKTAQIAVRITEETKRILPAPPGGEVVRASAPSEGFTENRYRDKRGGLTAPR